MIPTNKGNLRLKNRMRREVLEYDDDFSYGKVEKWIKSPMKSVSDEVKNLIFSTYWNIVKKIVEDAGDNEIPLPDKGTIENYYKDGSGDTNLDNKHLKSFRYWAFGKVGAPGPGVFQDEAKKLNEMEEIKKKADAIKIFDSIANYCSPENPEELEAVNEKVKKIVPGLECGHFKKSAGVKMKVAIVEIIKNSVPQYVDKIKQNNFSFLGAGGRKRKRKRKRKTKRKRRRKTKRKKRRKRKTKCRKSKRK